MIVELLSAALIGTVAYSTMYSKPSGYSETTQKLNENINNGFRFRDITYTDQIELHHPDVKNNSFYFGGAFALDRGNNGIPRAYSQLYPGTSEITQFTLREHLFL